MRKPLFALLVSALPFFALAQNELQSFGKVDKADIDLKECPFEKDAHAMVLFDKGEVYFDQDFNIVSEFHKRIKVFNQKAKDQGDVRLEFYSANRMEEIYDLSAQTINYKDGKPVITRLDKKQIFTEAIDKNWSAMIFTFPDVQEGSIIEYKYKKRTWSIANIPTWFFQHRIPCRYSEFSTAIPDLLFFKSHFRVHQDFYKNKSSSLSRSLNIQGQVIPYTLETKHYAFKDIPALKDEPFMTSMLDNLESVVHQLTSIKPINGFVKTFNDTWKKVGETLIEDEDFGSQLKKKISDDNGIVVKAKAISSQDKRIAFIFNEVRNAMKWNGRDRYYVNEGLSKAWEKKTGNSTEINLILYRLLKQADIEAFPMLVSTREHGKVNVAFPSLYQFNRTVVYIPVDSVTRYVLDASNKYNQYNNTPDNILNSYGLYVDRETKSSEVTSITSQAPVRKNIFIDASISGDGKMTGTANLTDFSYHKISNVELLKKDGEDKLKDKLINKNVGLKIKDFSVSNADVDSLPLAETLNFELELPGSDGSYIYFNPNLFTAFTANPFLNENRVTTIDLGYNSRYAITGSYKIPSGYKPDVLPGSKTYVMPDKSITFQRIIVESEGVISIRYVIDFKKSIYTTDEYPYLRQFYKQMYELLNEQIVLKKS